MKIRDGDKEVHIHKGDTVFTNFIKAGMDPKKFPNPKEINLDRPDRDYIHHGWGAHSCIGRKITVVAMAAQLRVFGRLKNLRRAPGSQGQMKSVIQKSFKVYMKADWSDYWPFPTTMKVHFDGFDEGVQTPIAGPGQLPNGFGTFPERNHEQADASASAGAGAGEGM